jgi:hypothetical protein
MSHVGKWETVRRRKFGALRKLFMHRYAKNGHGFTDDCAGRDDLFLLLCFASLAPTGGHEKMKHIIETQAPWMQPEEAQGLANHVHLLTAYERNFNSRDLVSVLASPTQSVSSCRCGRLSPTTCLTNNLQSYAKPSHATDERLSGAKTVSEARKLI